MDKINQLLESLKNIKEINILDIIVFIGIIAIFKIFNGVFAYILVKMFHLKVKDKNKIKRNAFYKPLKIFFVLLGIYIGLSTLKIPKDIFTVITKLFKICIIILGARSLANTFSTTSDTFEKLKNKLDFKGTDTAVNFISKVIKAVVYIVAGFVVIKEIGYDLNGLATGLGIGSVVIALAAQDLAKNIIGGFSIILDKPFEIGDYIETSSFKGTIEDITFRTTRVRDVNNQIIIVPNSKIADECVTNVTKRERRRYELKLVLEIDTPLEKVNELSKKLKEIFEINSNILKESILVYFDTISDNGIDLQIALYTNIIDANKYIEFKEQLNYQILSTIEKEHIELAYPSQTIYVKQ